jgi:hypothetical protein
MSASDVETLMSAAATAIEAGDYATALAKALAAQARLAAIPDSGWREGPSMKWRPESIQNFIDSARRSQTATGGVQRTKIQYTRTSAAT